ncbi:retrovirus-related pol polyprotein from transposon TNT 1-94 [Tanacetum coccineum]
MTTLADKSLLSGGDNKPPMLEKHLYDSWKSRMELYMMNRPHGRMILASVEKGPLVWPSITVDGVTRLKEYTELTPAEAIQADCDIKAINIILQGLPTEIYALVSQHRVAKDLWEKIKLLMQGTSLTKQERECKLYDEFDKFTYKKGESLHEYYLRFILLLNDINIYKMPLEQFQVNTKFLNTLPDEWSKFVTDVKLVKDLHTTNVDQLHAYLEQHERHANEVPVECMKREIKLLFAADHFQRDLHSRSNCSNSRKQKDGLNCYNCKGEGHMSRQCTKPKRKRDDSWFKEKVLLLDAYDAIIKQTQLCQSYLMANLSHYGSDALAESVNDTLTHELERYKEQVKVLKEGQNVDLRSKDNVSDTCAQSLLQTVTLLKNDFKKEESRNIDREIALEKQIKQLDNIVFKRDQSAQIVHMLTKPQFFYNNTTKQALGFQNPYILQNSSEVENQSYMLVDIIIYTNPDLIPDSEGT